MMHRYGFLVSQSYSEDFGTPGTKSTISGVNFTGSKTTVTTSGKYPRVGVDCAKENIHVLTIFAMASKQVNSGFIPNKRASSFIITVDRFF